MENLGHGGRGNSKGARRFPGVAAVCRHDVENVGDELRIKFVGRLDVSHAPGKFQGFGRFGRFADVERDGEAHPMERMNLVFIRAPAFAGFDC